MKIVCVGGSPGLIITEMVGVSSEARITPGCADLCCLARPHLVDPYWTLHAAAQLG